MSEVDISPNVPSNQEHMVQGRGLGRGDDDDGYAQVSPLLKLLLLLLELLDPCQQRIKTPRDLVCVAGVRLQLQRLCTFALEEGEANVFVEEPEAIGGCACHSFVCTVTSMVSRKKRKEKKLEIGKK